MKKLILFLTCILLCACNKSFNFNNNKVVRNNGFYYYEDDIYYSELVIDVSAHDKEIDWSLIKNAGIKYAYIRSSYRGQSEGKLYLDKYFNRNIQLAKKYGIKVGVYHFSQAINQQEAKEEANFVYQAVKPYSLDLPIVFDMEYENSSSRISKLGREAKTIITQTFIDEMLRFNYMVMIYGNYDWFNKEIDYLKFKEQPIWFAGYQATMNFNYPIKMWQYSDNVKIKGISKPVDMSIILIKKVK